MENSDLVYTLPKQMIEAGAKAYFRRDVPSVEWFDAPPNVRQSYEERAEQVITAALAAMWSDDMESAPRDVPIVAWHIVWDCEVTIEYRTDDMAYMGLSTELDWIEKTKTTAWPSAAFSHWRLPLPKPKGQ